jgi:hypothetical protein
MSNMLHLVYNCVWCWNLDTTKVYHKYLDWNVMLEKDWDQLDWLCEKLRIVTKQRVKKERNVMHTVKRGKANWNGQILYRNCLLKHVTEGKKRKWRKDEEEDVSRYWVTLREQRILEIERGSTMLHSVDNWLWKKLGSFVKQTTEWMNPLTKLNATVVQRTSTTQNCYTGSLNVNGANFPSFVPLFTPFFLWRQK